MHKNITLSVSVDKQLHAKIMAVAERLKDDYGKANMAHALRRLIEAGLEKYESHDP